MEEHLARYAARIEAVYPAVSAATLRRIGQGQNNDAFLVNDMLIFRFPRYQQGILALEREVSILQALQGRLPVAIPNPLYVALRPPIVGQVFMGYPLVPGLPLEQTLLSRLDASAITTLGHQLGDVLRCLHQAPLDEVFPADAPRAHLRDPWEDLYTRIQQRLFGYMRPEARAWTAAHFETFLRNPRTRSIRAVLTHGDLGAGNILYDARRGALVGMIDFSGAGPDDSAVDLAAIATLRADMLDAVVRAYPQELEVLERAAFYRGTFALQEALFGVENNDEAAFRAGISAYL